MIGVMAELPENDRITGPFLAEAGQTDFPADFPLIRADGLRVWRRRGDVGVTLSGGDVSAMDIVAGGFTARLTEPCAAGDQVWVYSQLPALRDRRHPPGGAVRTQTLEDDAVYLEAQAQEARRDLDAAIRVEPGGTAPTADEIRNAAGAGQSAAEAQEAAEQAAAAAEAIRDNKLNLDGGNSAAMVGLEFNAPFELKHLGDASVPPDGVYIGSGGINQILRNPLSTPAPGAPDNDHQRAALAIVANTRDDGNSQEQAVKVVFTAATGYAREWLPSTEYALGDNVQFPHPRNAVYRCIQAGVSSPSGEGPSGGGLSIQDGTCVWMWINDAAINAKASIYNEVHVKPGAGSVWGQATNLQMEAGAQADFIVNTELDLTNYTGFDSGFGFKNKYNLWLACQGANRSTSALEISSANTDNDAVLWGLHFAGARLASNSVIGIDASSLYGIGVGAGAGGAITPTFTFATFKDMATAPISLDLRGTYSEAAINIPGAAPAGVSIHGSKALAGLYDASTTPIGAHLNGVYDEAGLVVTGTAKAGVEIGGAKSIAAFWDVSVTPVGVNLSGEYSNAGVNVTGGAPAGVAVSGSKGLAGFYDASTAPVGFEAAGTYGVAAFASNFFEVNSNGRVTGRSFRALQMPTIATSSDTGAQGQFLFDANYIYVCVATNTWKRVALSAF